MKVSLVCFVDEDNDKFDKWEIQWNAFVQVENIFGALGSSRNPNMPKSLVLYDPDDKC